MSIIENKDIYDPSQGNPFETVTKFLELLEQKVTQAKDVMKGLEKSLSDVAKTSDGQEAKKLIQYTDQLTTETEKLIVVENARLQLAKQLETAQTKYVASTLDNAKAVKAMQVEAANLNQQRTIEAKLASNTTNVMQKYKLELRELKGVLLTTTEGTKEYNKALQRAAFLTDEISDMNIRVKGTAMDFDGVMGNTTKVTQGAASMFEIAQGAEALFGIESEDLAKTLVKVQAAMAIANGLQGLDGMGKAFKNLLTQIKTFASSVNKALLASGIGAFALALSGIVIFWDKIKFAVTGVSVEQEKLKKQLTEQAAIQQHNLELAEGQDNILKLQGESEDYIIKSKIFELGKLIEIQVQTIRNNQAMRAGQIEAEQRNKDIVMGLLQMTIIPIRVISFILGKLSDAYNAITGKQVNWRLNIEAIDSKIAEMIFDPASKQKELDEIARQEEKKLQELNDKQAAYRLQLIDLDKQRGKAASDLLKEQEKLSRQLTIDFSKNNAEQIKQVAEKAEKIQEINTKLAEQDAANKEAEIERQAAQNEILTAYREEQEKEEQESYARRAQLVSDSVASAASKIGELAAQGVLTFKQFSKIMLITALDAVEKELLLIQTQILAKEIASKSFFGIASAAGLIALISGSFAFAKAKINSFAVGTDYLTGPKTGPTGGIYIEGHEGEMILTANETKQMMGVSHKDVPSIVRAGLSFYKMESILRQVRDNSEMTNEYLSRQVNSWKDGNLECIKDIKTNIVRQRPI